MTNEEKNVDVSVVVPVFNEKDSLNELTNLLKEALTSYGKSFELIFVDDGSTDDSFDTLMRLKDSHPEFRVIKFQMNYGKSSALSTGFDSARGDYVVTIDSDLQDDPKEIPILLEKLLEGYDLVSGWKKHRKDPISKTFAVKNI